MNYFDIFRIDFEDLKIIAEQPSQVTTSVTMDGQQYFGEIVLAHQSSDSLVLFRHEEGFSSEADALSDLNQIIDTISKAYANTKASERLREQS